MRTLIWAVLVLVMLPFGKAAAQERHTLGYGTIFNNDYLGDGKDRWRSGSYRLSAIRGPAWSGKLPDAPGEILEYRFQSEIIAPDSLNSPKPGDRRYAGIMSFGVHTHFNRAATDYALGADLVFVGPQTGVGRFHARMHDWLGEPSPSAALSNQLGNAVYPTVLAQAVRPVWIGTDIRAMPFIEAQLGVESLVRIGGDLVFGTLSMGSMGLRDMVTGQVFSGIPGIASGAEFIVGGDMALVGYSAYLPSSGGYDLTPLRKRLRAGVRFQTGSVGLFYGITWLGKEFRSQTDEQLVGSLDLRLKF